LATEEKEQKPIDNTKFNKSLQDMAKGMGDLAVLFSSSRPSIAGSTKALEKMFGVSAPILSGFAGYLENQVKLYQNISKSGVSFNGQLEDMGKAAINAGLTVEEFAKGIKENSENFVALGLGTATKGAITFYGALKEMRTGSDGFATRLRRMGYDFDDFQESMGLVAQMQSFQGLSEAQRQKALASATYEYMDNLDTLSRLTGKQKDQLNAEMKAAQNQGRVKAMILELEAQGGEQAKKAAVLQEGLNKAVAMGPKAVAAYTEIMATGTISKENALYASQMGLTTQALQDMRRATFDQTVSAEELKKYEARVQGARLKDLGSAQNRAMAQIGSLTPAGAAMEGAYTETSMGLLRFGAQMEREGKTAEEAAAAWEALSDEEKKKLTEDKKPGDKPDPAAALKGTLAIQEKLVDMAAKTQTKAIDRLYKDLATPAVVGFVAALNQVDPSVIAARIGEATDKFIGGGQPFDMTKLNNLLTVLEGEGGSSTGVAQSIRESLTKMNDASASPEARRAAIEEIKTALRGLDPEKIKGVIQRDTGSVGKTGNILENFGKGTPAMLHGKEAVLTEEQLTNLAKGLQTEGAKAMAQMQPQMESMTKTIAPQMKSMAKTMAPKMEGMAKTMAPQLQGMLNTIRPQMQSMATQMQPQMQNMAEQMAPMMKQMAEQMQGPMKEMAESMKGPMESMAGNMQKSLGVATKQLKTQKGLGGNIFQNLGL